MIDNIQDVLDEKEDKKDAQAKYNDLRESTAKFFNSSSAPNGKPSITAE